MGCQPFRHSGGIAENIEIMDCRPIRHPAGIVIEINITFRGQGSFFLTVPHFIHFQTFYPLITDQILCLFSVPKLRAYHGHHPHIGQRIVYCRI